MKNIYDALFEVQRAAAEAKRSEPAVRDDPVRAVQAALELWHRYVVSYGLPSDSPDGDLRRRVAAETAFLGLAGLGEVILRWADARCEDADRAAVARLAHLPDAVNQVLDTGRLPDGVEVRAAAGAWSVAGDAFTASIRPLVDAAENEIEREEASRYVTRAVVASVSGAWMLGRA
jgi:hypothetical protein